MLHGIKDLSLQFSVAFIGRQIQAIKTAERMKKSRGKKFGMSLQEEDGRGKREEPSMSSW